MHAGCGAYMEIIVDSYCFFYSLVRMNSTFYVTCSHVCESVDVLQRLLFHLQYIFFLKLLLGKQFLACM